MKKDLNNCAEQIISGICANMGLEGLTISETTKEECYAVVLGERDADELVREYIENFSRSSSVDS